MPTATKKTEASVLRSQVVGKAPLHILLLLSAILVLLPIAGAAPWGAHPLVGDPDDFGMGHPMCQKRTNQRLRKIYES
jgi:hypothetical protein